MGTISSYPLFFFYTAALLKNNPTTHTLTGTKNRTRVAIGSNTHQEKNKHHPSIITGTKNRTHEAIKQTTHKKKETNTLPILAGTKHRTREAIGQHTHPIRRQAALSYSRVAKSLPAHTLAERTEKLAFINF